MNSEYIQTASPEYKNLKTQIINCESGKFDKVARSDFDISFDKKSEKPGIGIMEKLCSGAYMGPIAFEAVTAAGKENLFSEKLSEKLSQLDSLTQIEMDSFLHAPYSTNSKLGSIMAECAKDDDYDVLFQLLDALVERCARMAAAILSACVIKSGEGKTADKPVCILCNGTSFFKTYKVRQRVLGYLEEILVKERGLYFDVISRENDITLGTAIGGLL